MKYSEALVHPDVFGGRFEGPSWEAWRVVDAAIFGEPIPAKDMALFTKLTGRTKAPTKQAKEIFLACGRRAGKTDKTASYAAYAATFMAAIYNWRARLKPGEMGVVQVLAVDRDGAKVMLDRIAGFFSSSPILRRELAVKKGNASAITADSIELRNGITIEVVTNDQRRVRGRTVVCAIFEEVAHWLASERSVTPDVDVYRAVRPAQINVPGALLIGISSPYARRGLLWDKYRKHYGVNDDPVLIVQAPTELLNPSVDREFLAAEYEADEASASAEYGAQFRRDIEAFLSKEAVDAITSPGVIERPPIPGIKYVAFTDPSGGSNDSFTLAIAHAEMDPTNNTKVAVLDAIREIRPPFSPDQATREHAALLGQYGIKTVTGDRYGGLYPRERFVASKISYTVSEKTKSDIYKEALPLINSRRCDLLEHKRLGAQLVSLERRTARGGRDSVDHPPNGHDDVANAVCGALVLASGLTAKSSAGWLFRRPTKLPVHNPFPRYIDPMMRFTVETQPMLVNETSPVKQRRRRRTG